MFNNPPPFKKKATKVNRKQDLVFVPVGSDQELCGRFRGGVRVRRPHRTALIEHLRTAKQQSDVASKSQLSVQLGGPRPSAHLLQAGAVHLVGADVDEALWPVLGLVGGLQQDGGAVHVDALEGSRGLERQL